MLSALRKGWVNIMMKKHLKFRQKEKNNNDEISGVINKSNENTKRKKLTETMTVESKRVKTTIKHPRERKKLHKQKMAENNSKLFLSGKFNFDLQKIFDKFLLFNLKKASEEKVIDSILEKIPDKNDIYYMERRKGTNASRIRKDSKQAKKDVLKTMLETIDRGIKRATSKSKLYQLKRI